MGCDIHPHIEFFSLEDPGYTSCFAYYVDLGRDYTMFNAMAGVRGMGDCVVDPRGLPAPHELSFEVFGAFYMQVVDTIPDHHKNYYNRFECGWILKDDAERHIKQNPAIQLNQKGQNYICNPDYHTPSHLFLNEMIAVRRKYLLDTLDMDNVYKGKKRKEVISKLKNADEYELMKCCFAEIESPRLNAILASMIAIENSGPYKSRFVFWFDS